MQKQADIQETGSRQFNMQDRQQTDRNSQTYGKQVAGSLTCGNREYRGSTQAVQRQYTGRKCSLTYRTSTRQCGNRQQTCSKWLVQAVKKKATGRGKVDRQKNAEQKGGNKYQTGQKNTQWTGRNRLTKTKKVGTGCKKKGRNRLLYGGHYARRYNTVHYSIV